MALKAGAKLKRLCRGQRPCAVVAAVRAGDDVGAAAAFVGGVAEAAVRRDEAAGVIDVDGRAPNGLWPAALGGERGGRQAGDEEQEQEGGGGGGG